MFTSYLNEHLTYFERYTRFLYIGNYFYFFKVGTLIVPQGSVSVLIFRRTLIGYYAEGMHANF